MPKPGSRCRSPASGSHWLSEVDCLVDGIAESQRRRSRGSASIPPCPRCSTRRPGRRYSSLNTMGHEVIAALGQPWRERGRQAPRPVVRQDKARGQAALTGGATCSSACERHGARLVQDADASPWLHAADLLVTDHSSVGFEFMLLDRPIVVLDSPELIEHARVSPDKVSMLRSAAAVRVRTRGDSALVRERARQPGASIAPIGGASPTNCSIAPARLPLERCSAFTTCWRLHRAPRPFTRRHRRVRWSGLAPLVPHAPDHPRWICPSRAIHGTQISLRAQRIL